MGTVGTFVFLDFKFDDISDHTIKSLILFFVFACFLAPFYVYLSKQMLNETMNEAKLLYTEKDSFRQLFDALQECIIVLQSDQISFVNSLAQNILNKVFEMDNTAQNILNKILKKDEIEFQ